MATTHIKYKRGFAYFRRQVPADLRAVAGREIWIPLRATDKQAQRNEALKHWLATEETLAKLRVQHGIPKRTPGSSRGPGLLRQAMQAQAPEGIPGLPVIPSESGQGGRLKHYYDPTNEYHVDGKAGLVTQVSLSDRSVQSKPTMDFVLRQYLEEKDVTESTKREWTRAVTMLNKIVGRKLVNQYTREDILGFRNVLLGRTRFGTTTREETINRWLRDPKQQVLKFQRKPLKPATAKKLVGGLSTLFNFARREYDWCTNNPTEQVKVEGSKDHARRKLFTDSQLRDVLAKLHGNWLEWPVWVAMLSGMRQGEVAQLRPEDVRERDGIPFFSINVEANKSLKTAASIREVPIHPALIQRGLMELVATRQGQRELFGKDSRQISRGYATFLDRNGYEDEGFVFHGWRHQFKDWMREAGIDANSQNAILGHSEGGMGAKYGAGASLKRLAAEIAKIRSPV